jgi:DNA-binding CsgD family transcriptional regulator
VRSASAEEPDEDRHTRRSSPSRYEPSGSGEPGWDGKMLLASVGRAHLRYGEWLGGEKRRAEARVQLRTALDIFDAVGTQEFAERARIELQAVGERTKRRSDRIATDLTPRELQIARLAAIRLTSREIATELFISPHTVEYHLRKVFQKLGVDSRRDLATSMEVL